MTIPGEVKIISCSLFYQELVQSGLDFFTGVPDSLLKDICAFIDDHTPESRHIIAANEGNAVALAAGQYLAAGKPGLVYMQNSGLGNAVNPLVSLTDPMVYRIPVLLLIGWRGSPGVKDEPQHAKQGMITLPLLETLGIEFEILPDTEEGASRAINRAFRQMRCRDEAYALVVHPGTFKPYSSKKDPGSRYALSREETIRTIISQLAPGDVVVSTTGKISREVYACRDEMKAGHQRDFISVGSMGHASQIALGIAENKPARKVYCLDGDGALIMHMGALAIIGARAPGNFRHVVLNNGAHDSVGGQPTAGFTVDLPAIAGACGYKRVFRADSKAELLNSLDQFPSCAGPSFLEVRVSRGSRKDLGRPKTTPLENKQEFMKFLSGAF